MELLLIGGSHGFPATLARFARLEELALALLHAGAEVDVVVLLEKELEPHEADQLERLRALVRSLHAVPHPRTSSFLVQTLARARDALSTGAGLGSACHCPRRLASFLRMQAADGRYDAVIVRGVHLARALDAFPPWTEKMLDVDRLGFEAHRSHVREGRPDALEMFSDGARELDLMGRADAVLVASAMDAALLREHGFTKDLILSPPAAAPRGSPRALEPIRPPRILCVGSDTTANLDGVRWFRRQVFPAVTRAVPTCRLRLVGELARHIEPGPYVDRIGWVEQLDEEYRNSAVVALPLRMGSGVHRRAVEALAHGKALATTLVGAAGLGLVHGRDAVVSQDPRELAAEIVRVLTSDSTRRSYESGAARVAREVLAPGRVFAGLLRHLDLHLGEPREAPAREALAIAR